MNLGYRHARHRLAAACLLLASVGALAEEPLYEQDPYDQITLNELNEAGEVVVLQIKPLKLPPGTRPEKFRKTDKLIVELLDKPDQKYELEWRSVLKYETFDELVLAKASELAKSGRLDEAYQYFSHLEATRPELPGLKTAIEDYLLAEAKALHAAKQYEGALAMLHELHRRNPKRPELEKALGVITEKLVEQHVAADNHPAARGLVRTLAAWYPQNARVAEWQAKWKHQAAELLAQARAALEKGELRQADQLRRRLTRIWPALPEAKALAEAIHQKYARVVVGVTAPATAFEPGRLNDWAARRASRLLYRTLMEYIGPGPEGGRYYCPVGQMRSEDLGRRLVFQLRPGLRWASGEATLTGYDLARRLLMMAEPQDRSYLGEWSEILQGVAVEDVYTVVVDLGRPHVRPEALLQTPLVPAAAASDEAPLPNGPYVVEQRGDQEITYLANPRYASALPTQPKEIVERHYRLGAEGVLALKQRQIDVLERVNPWELSRLRADPDLVVERYAAPLVHCLVPNRRKPLTSNRVFCRALVYGIRRDAILERLLGERSEEDKKGCEVVSGPFPAGVGYNDPIDYAYDKSIVPRVYDPRLAVTLTEIALRQMAAAKADAGTPPDAKPANPGAEKPPADKPQPNQEPRRKVPRLVLAYPAHEIAEVACKGIQRQLEVVGIPIALEELPPTVPQRVPDHVDLLYAELAAWEPVVDARRLLGEEGLSGGCSVYMSLALGQLEREAEWRKVGDRLRQVHRIAHDDVAVVPLWQLTDHFAYHRSLQGVGTLPVRLYQNVEQWQPGFYYPSEEP